MQRTTIHDAIFPATARARGNALEAEELERDVGKRNEGKSEKEGKEEEEEDDRTGAPESC